MEPDEIEFAKKMIERAKRSGAIPEGPTVRMPVQPDKDTLPPSMRRWVNTSVGWIDYDANIMMVCAWAKPEDIVYSEKKPGD